MLDETKPPLNFGQYDHYLVMYRLAHMPPARIQPLLDDRQWKALQPQLNQYRGMQSFLIQQGLLPPEDVGGVPDLTPATEVQ